MSASRPSTTWAGPAGPSAPSTDTHAERVYQRLRGDIVGGHLSAGRKLPFAFLGERYAASVGTLREALSRLAEQGLVTAAPKIGFRVVSVSMHDLADLTDARCEIETLALRRAIADGDLAWESTVVAAFHLLDRTPVHDPEDAVNPSPGWKAVHAEFHTTLLAACGNRRIREIATELRDVAELYRNHYMPSSAAEQQAREEHRALMESVIRRDSETGVQTLRAHIDRTARNLANASGVAPG